MDNPYKGLPSSAFWKTSVLESFPNIGDIYSKKFPLNKDDAIATAGSCFAQHIARNLRIEGYNTIDKEPAPAPLPASSHEQYGYSMYSGRYGNIYTVQQLLQLARKAFWGDSGGIAGVGA